ncbi:putative sulfite oxidase [Toxoplasma gondii TgCatPRC2]|uniref:Putative sulfite oxidase n=1 Tax=Toxoplasma gondii TgCatPRC2 TaxID=1130821 RepID=A0A151GZN1_TOXGO|nr:putative sulfite oxidase [Toxoplasma gondii TgCatPRC2]
MTSVSSSPSPSLHPSRLFRRCMPRCVSSPPPFLPFLVPFYAPRFSVSVSHVVVRGGVRPFQSLVRTAPPSQTGWSSFPSLPAARANNKVHIYEVDKCAASRDKPKANGERPSPASHLTQKPTSSQAQRSNPLSCLASVFLSSRYPLPVSLSVAFCCLPCLQRRTLPSFPTDRGQNASAPSSFSTGCPAPDFPLSSRASSFLFLTESYACLDSFLGPPSFLKWGRHPSDTGGTPRASQEAKVLDMEPNDRRRQSAHKYRQDGVSFYVWPLAVVALFLVSPVCFSHRPSGASSSSPLARSASRCFQEKAFLWPHLCRAEGALCKSFPPGPAPAVLASSEPTASQSPASPSSESSSSALPASPSSSPSLSTASAPSSFPLAGELREDLPFYTVSDVKEHGAVGEGKRLWVAYRHGVYDVTDFLEKHPGGRDRLLLAVGRDLDPFWRVYGQHNLASVHELLESMRIGNIAKLEEASDSPLGDAYGNEPVRHPALVVRSEKPFNAETPLALLTDDFFTPNDLFFVRNHLPVPQVDKEKYEVEIEIELPNGEKKRFASFTLSDLQTKFYPHHLPCTLQCAGNRREDFNRKSGKRVKGLEWCGGAIGNALWTGCLLADVLRHCGFGEEEARRLGIRHIHFEGHDCDPLTHTYYAASIPIHRALLGQTVGRGEPADPFCSTTSFGSRDVLLVYEMNGQDLPIDHGAPVRVLVPGTVGARSVKWLKKITLSPRECGSHWQQQDYKIMSPSDEPSNTDEWRSKPSIVDLPVQSAICLPTSESILPPGTEEVDLKGYAWCGGGRSVVRVDVSLDGGETWTEAELQRRPSGKENEEEAGTKMENQADGTHEEKAWSW